MSIATAIQNAQQKVADAYTAISNKGGTLPATQNLSNMPTAIGSISTGGTIDTLTITPTTSQQTITASGGVDGYSPITVNAVTSSIDANIQAGNIKSGVSILGVNGSVTELNGSSRSVSLTSSSGQTFNPETGKNAITSITVTPNNQAKTITPTTSSQSITVPSGYSGFGTLTVNAVTSSIDNNITAENIKKDVTILGVTGTYEGSGGIGITREVSATGVYQMPASNFTFSLPSNATYLGSYAMYYAFYNCTGLTSVDLSSLTTVGGSYAMNTAFYGCTGLTSVDLSSLTTVSGNQAMVYAFQGCTGLTLVDLSSLTTVSGNQAMQSAFYGCTGLTSVDLSSLTTVSGGNAIYQTFWGCTKLTSVDLSSLTTISGSNAMYYAFRSCTKLTSVDLSSLTTVSGNQAMVYAFSQCTSLTSLSFPALTSTSFGSYTNQFNNMLQLVTGCTVHFPSNLQSVIGSWSSVTSGFGGTNTTVLYDLPATS